MELTEKTIYVLQYALDVIENAELGNTVNKSNWVLDESLEECIKELECEREKKQLETEASDICHGVSVSALCDNPYCDNGVVGEVYGEKIYCQCQD